MSQSSTVLYYLAANIKGILSRYFAAFFLFLNEKAASKML